MKNLKIKFPILLLFFFSSFLELEAQLCHFDDMMNEKYMESPGFQYHMQQQFNKVHDMMDSSPQAIMESGKKEVCVVFHIIHVGDPTFVSPQQVTQTLEQLNQDFCTPDAPSYNPNISFCLANVDPDGNPSTGINLVSGTSISSYVTNGIGGNNEAQVKALSIWDPMKYINIWIVHDIAGGALGYATFPNPIDPTVDGIVLDDMAIGGTANDRVVSHEMGHYLFLYHTFMGDCFSTTCQNNYSLTSCPDNTDCANSGDYICDTRAHRRIPGMPCVESSYEECDIDFIGTFPIANNHMNYTNNECRTVFTADQAMMMRATLMTVRSSLLHDQCKEFCLEVTALFDYSPETILQNVPVIFTNQSSGNYTSELWEIDGVEIESPNYTFEDFGYYQVCLTVTGTTCNDKYCELIYVSGSEQCGPPEGCPDLYNGDFKDANFDYLVGRNIAPFDDSDQMQLVCNWRNLTKSPDIYSKDDFVATYIHGREDFKEAIVTKRPLTLENGKWYEIELYHMMGSEDLTIEECSFNLGFSHTPDSEEIYDPSTKHIVKTIVPEYLNAFTFEDFRLGFLDPEEYDYVKFSCCFQWFDTMGEHFFIRNESSNGSTGKVPHASLFVKDISIDCCDCGGFVDLNWNSDGCVFDFSAQAVNTTGECYWTFGDGGSAIGETVTYEYDFPGTFTVCLTKDCETGPPVTTCEEVTVALEDCPPSCIELPSDIIIKRCDENETSYMGEYCFTIPPNTTPCNGSIGVFGADGALDYQLNSFSIANYPLYSEICISIDINDDNGFDIENNNTSLYLTLCDGFGEVQCLEVGVQTETCRECKEDVFSMAKCDDPDETDDIYVYTGSIEITGVSGSPCDFTSTEMGFESNTTQVDQDSWQIDYQITTSSAGSFTTQVLLCFLDGPANTCLTLNILIPEPCVEVDVPCTEKWNAKTTSDCDVVGDMIQYSFNMTNVALSNPDLELCGSNTIATVNSGAAMVSDVVLQNGEISFDTDIFFPCDYDPSGEYLLKVILCDERGDLVALCFPLQLGSCNKNCDSSRITKRNAKSSQGNSFYYPNPAMHEVQIISPIAPEKVSHLELLDITGKLILSKSIEQTSSVLDINNIRNGVHMLRIIDTQGNIIATGKLIILK